MRASFPETADKPARYVLTLAVASAQGQVAAMVALLERHGAYIEEFAVFDDALVSRFYVRIVFQLTHTESRPGFLMRPSCWSMSKCVLIPLSKSPKT